MDPKKVIQGLFTGLNIADSYMKSGQKMSPEVGLSAFFDRRFSDIDNLEHDIRYYVYCCRKDYPLLQDREVVSFYSGRNLLKGYLYRTEGVSRGLVLCVHGMAGMADDFYALSQNYFLNHGYDVFAIDLTASGASEGHGIPGLHQSALDVAAASDYLDSRIDVKNLPRYFFGHSWGGYGVSASLAFHPHVRAIAEVSGFDTPLKEMTAIPGAKLGVEVVLPREDIEEPLRVRAGEYYDLSASKAIMESGVPSLLLHGEDDQTVPIRHASIIESAEGHNVTKLFFPGKGHMDIFYAPSSIAYARNVMGMAQELTARYGKDVARIPKNEMKNFLSSFDKRMTSVPDEALYGPILEFFASH